MSYSDPGQPPPPPYGAPPPPPYGGPPRKSGVSGCLMGCLAVIGLLVLAVVVGSFALYTKFKNIRDQYTETAPVAIPTAQITDQEWIDLDTRINRFGEEMKAGVRAEPLTLTENEINAFLQKDSDYAQLGKNFHVQVEDDKLKGIFSIPLDFFPGLSGRYLNGNFYAKLAVINGELHPVFLSAEARDKPLDEQLLSMLNQNIEQEIRNPQGEAGQPGQAEQPSPMQDWKQKFSEVRIADDAITLVPEPASGAGEGEPADAAAPAADEAAPAVDGAEGAPAEVDSSGDTPEAQPDQPAAESAAPAANGESAAEQPAEPSADQPAEKPKAKRKQR